jgi:transcriptional regulator with XRE-family HTH domain
LRKLLDERKITQRELAAALNIAPTTLNNYVCNVREADYETLKLFAAYFDVSIDYLLGYPHKKKKSAQQIEMKRVFESLTASRQKDLLKIGKAFLKTQEE